MVTRPRFRALRRGGFTLAEVMVVVAIMGILAMAGSKLMTQIQNYFLLNRTRLITQQESRNILTMVTKDLRQAKASTILISRDSSSQPAASRIEFIKAGDDPLGSRDTTIVFYQKGNSLFRKENNKAPAELTANLRFLAFAFPRTDFRELVTVYLTLEKAVYQGKSRALHMTSESIGVMNQ